MKFSHTIQFNAVPEWREYYIAYSALKKLIYQIEKDIFSINGPVGEDLEHDETAVLIGANTKANKNFMPALDQELKRIVQFYTRKETDLYLNLDKICAKMHILENGYDRVDSSHLLSGENFPSGSGSEPTAISPLIEENESPILQASLLNSSPSKAQLFENPMVKKLKLQRRFSQIDPKKSSSEDTPNRALSFHEDKEILDNFTMGQNLIFTQRFIDLYVQLSELKNFVTLNFTGFAKILKKYDKVTGLSISKLYLGQTVQTSYPYLKTTKDKLDQQVQKCQIEYGKLRNIDDIDAFEELRTHMREHLVWERNTVWRDMISLERKAHAVGLKSSVAFSQPEGSIASTRAKSIKGYIPFEVPSFVQPALTFAFCLMIFLIFIFKSPFDSAEPGNCLALLIFASLLWATEVIPLFVTALMVPFLIVALRILKDPVDFHRLTAPDATKEIFASMFSPVIMLLLGGFSLASALSKHDIAKKLASMVLSYAGTNPTRVLLANMMVATFASMWISNVAAPVLCFSLIQPLLRTLPSKSPYASSLIMGIALASNIGGMASPISSPQNIIAISNMDPAPTWLQWFIISIPICLIGNLLVWLALLLIYRPSSHNHTLNHIRYNPEKFTYTQIYVCSVTILTIILWCLAHQLEPIIGDMGVIAIIPLVLFFGTGILSKDDFNNFLWTVIILAMGGIALGKGVKSSGLLHIIAVQVRAMVQDMSLFGIMASFCLFVLCITTCISHTVGAVIILPIVAQIGASLPDPHPRLLVMSSALMCSSAMGLPVSGFPNMNAIMMEDETGTRYLSVKDFLKAGIPSSILLYGVIVTLGYGILLLLGF